MSLITAISWLRSRSLSIWVPLGLALLILAPCRARAEIWPEGTNIDVTREFSESDQTIPLGESCHVTWTLTLNSGASLSGLYCSEQFPAWLEIDQTDAFVDGEPVSLYHEIGQEGENVPGLVPHRFVVFEPGSDWLNLELLGGQTLVLEYDLSSQVAGTVDTGFNGWCGLLDGGEDWGVGGYDDGILLQFGTTTLKLQDITIFSEVDHLRVIWSLSQQGESQNFRLQRGDNTDPWQSLPLGGAVLHGPGEYRYDDYTVLRGRVYWYWIAILDEAEHVAYHLGPGRGSLLDVAPPAILAQNFPNPFNPRTTLRFTLAAESVMELSIYDARGRCLRTLASGTWPAGMHELIWDGRDSGGRELASGNYFARLLMAGEPTQIRKLTLIR